MTKVLCICLGNICRSPLAEGVLSYHADKTGLDSQHKFDSAGTGSWHIGDPPDSRAINTAAKHGVDISKLRARQISRNDFFDFDLILAMDQSNLEDLNSLKPENCECELAKFLGYAGISNRDVPDPYYGDKSDFETVFTLINEAASKVLERLAKKNQKNNNLRF